MNAEHGVCPVCNGNKEIPLTATELTYSWNKNKTHRACSNCGGQIMFGRASGEVPLRSDGTPCTHEYVSSNIGRCLTRYSCKHCISTFKIDSGG